MTTFDTAHTIEVMWNEADRRARTGADDNARFRYLAWLQDPSISATKRARIMEVLAWSDAIWQEYGAFATAVRAGQRPKGFSALVPCPWTFWDIASA